MKYLVFKNEGEIDFRSLSTFGCSVKESKNPIGFFGTGGKFAFAILLRTGHSIFVQSGMKQSDVTSKTDTLRGKEFQFVHLGEMPLGFTTELGKTWEPWMAYRELYCNAKDEPGAEIYVTDEMPLPCIGITRVIVSGEAIMAAHDKKREFILEGEPAMRLGSVEVHNEQTHSFFYKGIKVMEFPLPTLFAYNQTEHLELTEDRTVKDHYTVRYALSRAVMKHAPRAMLDQVLVASEKFVEHGFDYHGWTGEAPSSDFFKAVGELQRSSLSRINSTALKVWREQAGGIIDPRRIQPTKMQAKMIEKAITFCEKVGFPLRDEYPIIIVESLGEVETLAIADKVGKQILLANRLFETYGTKGVARALMEEYLHLRFNLEDGTREMQNFIFDKFLSLAEEMNGEPL